MTRQPGIHPIPERIAPMVQSIVEDLAEHAGDFRPSSLEVFVRLGIDNYWPRDGRANWLSGFLAGMADALAVPVSGLLSLASLKGVPLIDRTRSPVEERRLESHLRGFREGQRWRRSTHAALHAPCSTLSALSRRHLPDDEEETLQRLITLGAVAADEASRAAYRHGFRDAIVLPLGG